MTETKMTQIDPICGMELHDPDAAGTSVYEGKTYYFCSPDCKEVFDEDPEFYVHDRTRWSERWSAGPFQ